MILYMYISAGQGLTTSGEKFWCQQKPLVTLLICYKFKKNLFEVWFYTIFFMILYMTTPWERNFNVNRNILSLRSFVASLKKISLNSDFIQLFHDFIHVYSPRARADSPQGTKFWCQQKGLITLPICCKFQRNLFKVWFYTIFFSWFNTCIYPWGRWGIQPPGDKVLMSTEPSCHFGHLLLVSNYRWQFF